MIPKWFGYESVAQDWRECFACFKSLGGQVTGAKQVPRK